MGLEIITDELIKELIEAPKRVASPNMRKKCDSGHEKITYKVFDAKGNPFNLYTRQNLKLGMGDSFSCGLSHILPSGDIFTLVRYNGAAHNHSNKLDSKRLGYKPHIHQATKLYLDETGTIDGYAEVTDRFKTLDGALSCLIEDCNITGLTHGNMLF